MDALSQRINDDKDFSTAMNISATAPEFEQKAAIDVLSTRLFKSSHDSVKDFLGKDHLSMSIPSQLAKLQRMALGDSNAWKSEDQIKWENLKTNEEKVAFAESLNKDKYKEGYRNYVNSKVIDSMVPPLKEGEKLTNERLYQLINPIPGYNEGMIGDLSALVGLPEGTMSYGDYVIDRYNEELSSRNKAAMLHSASRLLSPEAFSVLTELRENDWQIDSRGTDMVQNMGVTNPIANIIGEHLSQTSPLAKRLMKLSDEEKAFIVSMANSSKDYEFSFWNNTFVGGIGKGLYDSTVGLIAGATDWVSDGIRRIAVGGEQFQKEEEHRVLMDAISSPLYEEPSVLAEAGQVTGSIVGFFLGDKGLRALGSAAAKSIAGGSALKAVELGKAAKSASSIGLSNADYLAQQAVLAKAGTTAGQRAMANYLSSKLPFTMFSLSAADEMMSRRVAQGGDVSSWEAWLTAIACGVAYTGVEYMQVSQALGVKSGNISLAAAKKNLIKEEINFRKGLRKLGASAPARGTPEYLRGLYDYIYRGAFNKVLKAMDGAVKGGILSAEEIQEEMLQESIAAGYEAAGIPDADIAEAMAKAYIQTGKDLWFPMAGAMFTAGVFKRGLRSMTRKSPQFAELSRGLIETQYSIDELVEAEMALNLLIQQSKDGNLDVTGNEHLVQSIEAVLPAYIRGRNSGLRPEDLGEAINDEMIKLGLYQGTQSLDARAQEDNKNLIAGMINNMELIYREISGEQQSGTFSNDMIDKLRTIGRYRELSEIDIAEFYAKQFPDLLEIIRDDNDKTKATLRLKIGGQSRNIPIEHGDVSVSFADARFEPGESRKLSQVAQAVIAQLQNAGIKVTSDMWRGEEPYTSIKKEDGTNYKSLEEFQQAMFDKVKNTLVANAKYSPVRDELGNLTGHKIVINNAQATEKGAILHEINHAIEDDLMQVLTPEQLQAYRSIGDEEARADNAWKNVAKTIPRSASFSPSTHWLGRLGDRIASFAEKLGAIGYDENYNINLYTQEDMNNLTAKDYIDKVLQAAYVGDMNALQSALNKILGWENRNSELKQKLAEYFVTQNDKSLQEIAKENPLLLIPRITDAQLQEAIQLLLSGVSSEKQRKSYVLSYKLAMSHHSIEPLEALLQRLDPTHKHISAHKTIIDAYLNLHVEKMIPYRKRQLENRQAYLAKTQLAGSPSAIAIAQKLVNEADINLKLAEAAVPYLTPELVQTYFQGIDENYSATDNVGAFGPANPNVRYSISADIRIREATNGITIESLEKSIEDIIENKTIKIAASDGEKIAIKMAAVSFYEKYAKTKILLSTNSYLFFAPDERTVERYNGDRNKAWAEYALHQVTNNHKDDKGQDYRAFNKPKVEIVNPIIEQIVAEDKTEISEDGRIIFYSQLDENSYVKVVANPTEEGNYRADLTNVSSVYQKGKMPAKLNPLGAAVDRDGLGGVFTSKSTNESIKPNFGTDVNTPRYSITAKEDAAYLDAVRKGDMETAQRMVDEAERLAGYDLNSEYQGSLAFNGTAPSNDYYVSKEERKIAWENGTYEGAMSLGDFVDFNIDTHDLKWQLTNKGNYQSQESHTKESINNINKAIKNGNRKIIIYRAVPDTVKENSVRNGDWVTPSRKYAENHIFLQDWSGSRIIEQEVNIDNLWWNGDDINEWGYDDGNNYGYRNTENNRKLLDPVTYDDDGNVIPLSQRFNLNNPDIRYSMAGVRAHTANNSLLAKAQKMLFADGVDAEKVRQETGWFMGLDGEWRYEIDDSKAKFVFPNHIKEIQDAYQVKVDKIKKDFAEGKFGKNAFMNQMSRAKTNLDWANDTTHYFADQTYPLNKILEHPKLFEAYPQLKDMPVVFLSDLRNELGKVNDGTMYLNTKYLKEEYSNSTEIIDVILHEIQHEIQRIEGFAKGASPRFWDHYITMLRNEYESSLARLNELYEDIGLPDFRGESLMEVHQEKKTLDQHKKDVEDFKSHSERAKEIHDAEERNSYLWQQFSKILKSNNFAFEMYTNTAGEIESRDVSARRALTEAERLTTRPDVDRKEDVQFAEMPVLFSLKTPIETANNLIAVHNVWTDKLDRALNLGGLPMPSIAIVKKDDGHVDFGDISLIFTADTIDPKTNPYNKVYSGDAYTPTAPEIYYKVNDKVQDRIKAKYYELRNKVNKDFAEPLYRYAHELDNMLQRYGGEEHLILSLLNDYDMKNAFLADNDKAVPVVTTTTTTTIFTEDEIRLYEYISEKIGAEKFKADKGKLLDLVVKLKSEISLDVLNALKEKFATEGLSQDKIDQMLSTIKIPMLISKVAILVNNGATRTTTEYDIPATEAKIDSLVDMKEYHKWLTDLFTGATEATGIRNEKSIFSSSGNRRTWEALHYAVTLENIVKAMRQQGDKGIGTFGGGVFGAATTEYASLDDVRADTDRLKNIPEEENKQLRTDIRYRFMQLADTLPISDNPHARDNAANMLIEALVKYKTKKGMDNYLRRECAGWANYNSYILDEFLDIVSEIRQMPTGYFEAKPMRAVYFDEVAAAVIPDNTPDAIINRLKDYNIALYPYSAEDIDSRIKALNQAVMDKNAMFSLRSSNLAPDEVAELVLTAATARQGAPLAPKQRDSLLKMFDSLALSPDELGELANMNVQELIQSVGGIISDAEINKLLNNIKTRKVTGAIRKTAKEGVKAGAGLQAAATRAATSYKKNAIASATGKTTEDMASDIGDISATIYDAMVESVNATMADDTDNDNLDVDNLSFEEKNDERFRTLIEARKLINAEREADKPKSGIGGGLDEFAPIDTADVADSSDDYGVAQSTLAGIPLELFKQSGIDLTSGEDVAGFIREWVRSRLIEELNLDTNTDVFARPKQQEQYRKTVVNILRDMANKLMSPTSGYKHRVDKAIAAIHNGMSHTEVYNRSVSITQTIINNLAGQVVMPSGKIKLETSKEIVDRLRRELKQLALQRVSVMPLMDNLRRKVTARVEQRVKAIRHALSLSQQEVDIEMADLIAQLQEGRILDENLKRTGVELLAEHHDKMVRLQALNEFGGLKDKLPAEVLAKREDILAQVSEAQIENEKKMAKREYYVQDITQAIINAVNQSGAIYTPTRSVVSNVLDNAVATLRERLEFIISGASGDIYKKAQEAVDHICLMIARANENLITTKLDYQEEYEAMLGNIVGTKNIPAYEEHLKEFIPEQHNAMISKQGKRMTYGQVLHLWGYLKQADHYKDNIAMHNREGQLAYIEKNILTADDLALGLSLIKLYEQRREKLSKVMEEYTGLPIYSPSANYMPVSMKRPARAGLDAQVLTFTAFAKALTPRVKNDLDVDEEADVIAMYRDRSDDSARAISYGMTGILMTAIVGSSEFKDAVIQKYGKHVCDTIIEQVTDAATDGKNDGATKGFEEMTLLTRLRTLATYSALSWNLSPALKQLVSVPNWIMAADSRAKGIGWLKALRMFDIDTMYELSESKGFKARYGASTLKQSIVSLFRELSNIQNVGSINRDYQDARNGWKQQVSWLGQALRKVAVSGMAPMQLADIVPSMIVGTGMYKHLRGYYYEVNLKEGMSKEDAMSKAKADAATIVIDMIEDAQQSSRMDKQTRWYRHGGDAGKAFVMFASAANLQLSHEIAAARNLANKLDPQGKNLNNLLQRAVLNNPLALLIRSSGNADPEVKEARRRLRNAVMINHIYTPIVMSLVGELFHYLLAGWLVDDDDNDEALQDWAYSMIAACITGPYSGWWLIGSTLNGLLEGLLGVKSYGSINDSPALQLVEKITDGAGDVASEISECNWEEALQEALSTTGSLTAPTRNIKEILRNIEASEKQNGAK